MTPELSCYTTALVEHLGGTAADRLADAVRLWVRTDSPDGALAFSHHDRIDGGTLAYRQTGDWDEARSELADQLDRDGSVILVGNAAHLPWSPHHGVRTVPHWFLLRGRQEQSWHVVDPFHALMPGGEQLPYQGRLDDDALRRAMTPVGRLDPALLNRDTYALGAPAAVGALNRYRWLRHTAGTRSDSPQSAWQGSWLRDPADVLTYLRDRFIADEDILREHTDDLWAAARHQRHRLAAHPDPALADSWSQLPKALRFATESARRGRRRPGVVSEAFDTLIELTTSAEAHHDRP